MFVSDLNFFIRGMFGTIIVEGVLIPLPICFIEKTPVKKKIWGERGDTED